MTTPDLLAELDRVVRSAEPEDLPALAGRLREAELLAEMRLRTAPANGNGRPEPEAPEVLLTPEQALVAIGGDLSRKWLLRRTKGLRFRRGGGKVIRFERAGLLRWFATRRG